jgi:hypothetical protein
VKILWHNVFALMLVILVIVVMVSRRAEIGTFLAAMQDIGPGHNADEQVMGLIAFGLVLVAIVAVLKIVLGNDRKE